MDNSTTLLVAIMYVTVVATGLINVPMALSEIVGGQRKTNPVRIGRIVLVLSRGYRVHIAGLLIIGITILAGMVLESL